MNERRLLLRCSLRALIVAIAAVLAGATGARAQVQEAPADDDTTVSALADAIDNAVAARWQADGITPAEAASDAEFHRRTHLNIAGRIPTVWETREFLAATSPNKHRALVDRLLESPLYVGHFARTWRGVMLPEAETDNQIRFLVPGFESWLRDKLIDNSSYAEIARELISCTVAGNDREGPVALYRVKEAKPEAVASAVSRLFLGVRIDCAQCHDHPFADWKQSEFWGFAAFFSGIGGDRFGVLTDNTSLREIKIVDTDTLTPARFLDGAAPDWSANDAPREALADWVVSPENPYFARAAVNRVWAQFFGAGLVDPPDDFDELNPPSHPELLDRLAEAFVERRHDLKFLIRAITISRTYRLSSIRTHETQDDPRSFARMRVRPLTADQLIDSLLLAGGITEGIGYNDRLLQRGSQRGRLGALFTQTGDQGDDPETTLLQALAMMNGSLVTQATNVSSGGTLDAILNAPFLDTNSRIEALYLVVLCRAPDPEELRIARAYLGAAQSQEVQRVGSIVATPPDLSKSSGDDSTDASAAVEPTDPVADGYADLYWALLNSSEFLFNH